jgi:hypothetical protein
MQKNIITNKFKKVVDKTKCLLYNKDKLRERTKRKEVNIMLYDVEVRENNTQEFDDWVGDYTEAETKEEAIELVKQWLIDNGYTDDVEELEFNVEGVE